MSAGRSVSRIKRMGESAIQSDRKSRRTSERSTKNDHMSESKSNRTS